jgi:hypothetical protein
VVLSCNLPRRFTRFTNSRIYGEDGTDGFSFLQPPPPAPQDLYHRPVLRCISHLGFDISTRSGNDCGNFSRRFGFSCKFCLHQSLVENLSALINCSCFCNNTFCLIRLVGCVFGGSYPINVVGKSSANATYYHASNCGISPIVCDFTNHIFSIRRSLDETLPHDLIQVQSLDRLWHKGYNIIRCLRRGSSVGRAAD